MFDNQEGSKGKGGLRLWRAILVFLAAYVIVAGLAFGLYLLIAGISGTIDFSENFSVRHDPAYLLAEKLYPILNLAVWMAAAALYYADKRNPGNRGRDFKESLALGALWLIIVLPLDLVAFVLIDNPMAISAYDFYVVQFPWIYLTYVAVIAAPLCYSAWVKRRERTGPKPD